MQILSVLLGVFKFFNVISEIIKKLEKTPIEKRQDFLAKLDEAFESANEKNDTSKIEDLINR